MTFRRMDGTCGLYGRQWEVARVWTGLCPLLDNDSLSSSLSSLALHQAAEPQADRLAFVSVHVETSSLCSSG